MQSSRPKNCKHHCLGKTGVKDFLQQYWQKKPLLIRDAFPDIATLLTAEELAGLACEEHVNARLVLEKDGAHPWQLEFGPFQESRFSELPQSHWSLLVSDVEKHCPETREILKAFRFIPDWRIDDLMISYAPPGGSVGAHTDAYDVFLIQLSGARLWKIAEHFSDETLEGTDLSILKNFTAEQEWLLKAGDMLYLPPNIAHHGIAQNCTDKSGQEEHCLTVSVGFRAPSLKTIATDYVHYLSENLSDRYRDKKPVVPSHHAEISDETVSHFIDALKKSLTLEHEQVKRWLGQYCSDNKAFDYMKQASKQAIKQTIKQKIAHENGQQKNAQQENEKPHWQKKITGEIDEDDEIDLATLSTIAAQQTLQQSPYSHFLFSYTENAALLFVDGESYQVSGEFATTICNDTRIDFTQLQKIMTPDDSQILVTLFNNGSIIST